MTDQLYRDGMEKEHAIDTCLFQDSVSGLWANLERLQKENAGLRSEVQRVKGLLDTFLFEGSSSGRRYGLIWKRREELRKEHGLDESPRDRNA